MLLSYFHSFLVKHQYRSPSDSMSVSALQFLVAIHVTQWDRIRDKESNKGRFCSAVILQSFVQSNIKWLKLLKWFKLWHFGRVWNSVWQRCCDWRAGFVLSEMCGKCLASFNQNRIGSWESCSVKKLSKSSKRISLLHHYIIQSPPGWLLIWVSSYVVKARKMSWFC